VGLGGVAVEQFSEALGALVGRRVLARVDDQVLGVGALDGALVVLGASEFVAVVGNRSAGLDPCAPDVHGTELTIHSHLADRGE
jgi:hypothetical protein